MSDVLDNPTELLADGLRSNSFGAQEVLDRLHRHILAGGPLPEQWCDEGTAVGAIMDVARIAAAETARAASALVGKK